MNLSAANFWNGLSSLEAVLYVAPFVAFLLVLALAPCLPSTMAIWESNLNKLRVAGIAAIAGIFLYLHATGDGYAVGHTMLEYLAFVALLGSLYVISGGIHFRTAYSGTPWMNVLFLVLGALASNILGTMGASMVLVRPLLQINRKRRHQSHIFLFFIFIVSNCGGLLSPLGDPPLYLGFLRGVPFTWTFRLYGPWFFVNGCLLLVFFFLEKIRFGQEKLTLRKKFRTRAAGAKRSFAIRGWGNVGRLIIVLVCVALSGSWASALEGSATMAWMPMAFETLILSGLAFLSWKNTPARLHRDNQFSLHPLGEVAAIFLGVFGSMLPALATLQAKAAFFGLESSQAYFWGTGLLSGVLDNAPSYLTFSTLATSRLGLNPEQLGRLAMLQPTWLEAISCGATFMGAITYLGNGPNFIVRAVVQHAHVRMPSFGSYLIWACCVLLPLFIACSYLFFR